MIDIGTLNYQWSQSLIGGLAAAGVRHAVISPGSRSTPLALAALREPGLQCHMVIDERCAAFFALGIAKASNHPALVIATSGSAPANWLPAVIEASESGVPIILLSADRPPELHGCGANQTIEQRQLFAGHLRGYHEVGVPYPDFESNALLALAARAAEQARWPDSGPVHLNQAFREPLLPEIETIRPNIPALNIGRPMLMPVPGDIAALRAAISGRPGTIVCGALPYQPELAEAIAQLAEQLQCPVLAEPLSNLRFGAHDRHRMVVRYEDWLGDDAFVDAHPGEWMLRLGATPVTRKLQAFTARPRAVTAWIDPRPIWRDPAHVLTHLLRADPLAACRGLLDAAPCACPAEWFEVFAKAEAYAATQRAANASPLSALIAALQPGTALFVGNSLVIRQLDAQSGTDAKALQIYGNRGASGIDGNVSTALGIAAESGAVVAIVGDLTLQHDLGGLALAQGRNAVIVAVNNRGGGIFEYLPQRTLPEFERGWKTPQDIDFSHAAATFGLAYHHTRTPETLATTVAHAQMAGGPHLVELEMA